MPHPDHLFSHPTLFPPWRPRLPLISLVSLIFLLTLFVLPLSAQTPETELTLKLRRDFGYGGFAGDIEGTFSFRAEGPEDLIKVEFYIDKQLAGAATEPPWRYQFNTNDYGLGVHDLYASGYTGAGEELTSNILKREFVEPQQGWMMAAKIIIPIILLSLGIPVVMYIIDRRRGKRKGKGYGPWGATVCPKCDKPFGRHIWAPNLGAGKYDRCPHCGKWSMVRVAAPEKIAAAEALLEGGEREAVGTPEQMGEDDLRQRLEQSRFEDQ